MTLIRPSIAASSSFSISRADRAAGPADRQSAAGVRRNGESTAPGPCRASGGMMALTRLPSGRRASTIGECSSMRRPTRAGDPLNDLQQVLVVGEDGVRFLQAAEPLDIDLVRAVDEDVGDVRVLHVGLERPEAERFGDQFVDQPLFVDRGQLCERVRSIPSARWRMSSRSSSSDRPVIRDRSSESSSSRWMPVLSR